MRLPAVNPSTCPPAVREALTALPDLGLFRALGHASSAFLPWMTYGGALLTQLELDPVLRELAILQVAQEEGSEYEWAQHTVIAAQVGVTIAQVDALAAGRLADSALNSRESLVVGAAREFVRNGAISETKIADLLNNLGSRQSVELVLVLGQYLAVARLVASFAIPVDESARLAHVPNPAPRA